MQKQEKIKILRNILGKEKIKKGDELVFVCPQPGCRKDRYKLSVNILSDRFHCWICGFRGKNLSRIFKRGSHEDLERYLDSLMLRCETSKIQYEVPRLPDGFISMSMESRSPYYRRALDYLIDRGLTWEDILVWKLGYCEDGEYKHRIIFPSFDLQGELNFFVGRAIYPSMGLKYKHGNFSKDIIFNEYMIDWEKPVTLTEGPFDAITAGENAIPLQGTILRRNSKIFRKLVMEESKVYFALDSDAFKKQMDMLMLLSGFGVECYHVDLGGFKDVSQMGRKRFMEARERARKVSSTLDIIKIRMSA